MSKRPYRIPKNTVQRILGFACCALGALTLGAAAQQPRFFLVPQGVAPADVDDDVVTVGLRPRDTITFEVYIDSPEPIEIQRVDFGLPRLVRCGDSTTGWLEMVGVDVDTGRPDFLFAGVSTIIEPWGGNEFNAFVFVVRGEGSVTLAGDAKYCAEITYRARADACGTFALPIDSPTANYYAADADGARVAMTYDADTDLDGDVDIFDILCVLDGFRGVFDRCTLADVDRVPCSGLFGRGNGRVDMSDILLVLAAFQGIDGCMPGCGRNECPEE